MVEPVPTNEWPSVRSEWALGRPLGPGPELILSLHKGAEPPPWLTAEEAAARAQCGVKMIYREVKKGRLRAAKVGGRRELRLRAEWVDEWLTNTATPIVM